MTSVAFHVDQLFYRVPGGIGTYVRNLLPELQAADPGLELTVFHATFPRPAPRELDDLRRIDLGRGIRTLYPTWNLFGRPRLPDALARLDLVHAPSPGAVPAPGPNQRLVVTVHDVAFRLHPGLYPPRWRRLFRWGLRRSARADAVITVSEHTKRDLQRLTRIDPARIHVIPLAATLPRSPSDPDLHLGALDVPRPYVLFVGTLEPRKNLVRLVQAYRRIAGRVPHALVLAGPMGWGSERLRREVASEGPGRIVVPGRVSEQALDALYREAAIFAYPSLYEGFGLPVLEAMVRGVPTVVSRSSSLSEVAGDAAVQVDPGSIEELAEAMERLLADGDASAALGEAGRARAAATSWERTARRTLEVYREVLG